VRRLILQRKENCNLTMKIRAIHVWTQAGLVTTFANIRMQRGKNGGHVAIFTQIRMTAKLLISP
jgi:hypothetical protein